MSLVELVSSLLSRDDIHVPLAIVLELATEEHLVELEGLAADYNLNLSRIISNHLDDAVVYMNEDSVYYSKVGLVIRMWPSGPHGVTGPIGVTNSPA